MTASLPSPHAPAHLYKSSDPASLAIAVANTWDLMFAPQSLFASMKRRWSRPRPATPGNSDTDLYSILDSTIILMRDVNTNDDGFINIDLRPMTYAEAAAIAIAMPGVGQSPPQSPQSRAGPISAVCTQPRMIKSSPILTDEFLKSDASYQRSRQYKSKQHQFIKKKRVRNQNLKALQC